MNEDLVRRLFFVRKLLILVFTHPKKILKTYSILRGNGISGLRTKIRDINNRLDIDEQYQLWLLKNYPQKETLLKQKKSVSKFKLQPKISIITPVYNPPVKYLKECIESVLNQSYGNWELCLADDASTNEQVKKILKAYALQDSRIKYILRAENGHICKASNSALTLATGQYIALLDHDDILWPNALYEVVKTLNENPKTQFIYSDEDKLEEDGKTHSGPFFKPDWSPDYLRSINYITHFAVIKKTLVDKVGGFRIGFEGAQDWDLFLRVTSQVNNFSQIVHIPTILYSWRKSATSTASEKNIGKVKKYAVESQRKALEDDLQRRHIQGDLVQIKDFQSWQIKYKVQGQPLVSIIIPTKDKYEYIFKCLNSLLEKTTYINYEIVIIDTGSKDKRVNQLYKEIKKKHRQTLLLQWDKEFNFASVCNFGAKNCHGEYLLFLNNDTEVISPDWVQEMLGFAQRPEVGAVGSLLLYPDGRIQHLGGILGITDDPAGIGIAGHAHRIGFLKDLKHFDRVAAKNYSFVTGACLMIKKDKFDQIKGFSEEFKIAFNDIDLCLRLYTKKKLFNVINPAAMLFHFESATLSRPGEGNRDLNLWHKEVNLFVKKWGWIKDKDPFYNKNLTLYKEDFSLKV